MAAIDRLVDGWPETAREAAHTVAQKYGPPDEATDSFLIWHRRDPWKRMVLWRDEVDHDFPTPHKDVLEQVIDYPIPPEAASDIARFDGSVVLERTRGEMSARCEGEEANLLALNLAHRIATGMYDVDEARMQYADAMQRMRDGEPPQEMRRLLFDVPTHDTRDRDVSTMSAA